MDLAMHLNPSADDALSVEFNIGSSSGRPFIVLRIGACRVYPCGFADAQMIGPLRAFAEDILAAVAQAEQLLGLVGGAAGPTRDQEPPPVPVFKENPPGLEDAAEIAYCTCPVHPNGFRKEDAPGCPLHGVIDARD